MGGDHVGCLWSVISAVLRKTSSPAIHTAESNPSEDEISALSIAVDELERAKGSDQCTPIVSEGRKSDMSAGLTFNGDMATMRDSMTNRMKKVTVPQKPRLR